ncbi:MAG: hypothetical protein MUF02_06820 [Acidobacteria bacterium]|nr:hypothetical protein [Acidobacteriota bacterium]
MMLAVAGATSSRSFSLARLMCSSGSWPSANISLNTLPGAKVAKVSGAMIRVAAQVMTTVTSWPLFWKRRRISTALVAPIEPLTPRTSFMV